MAIRVWDYLDEYEAEKDDLLEGIEKVLRSGRLIFGESLSRFEAAFSEYCGVRFGVGVDNATNGLFLGLRALEIGPGDEVITVSNTAVPTVSAIRTAGARARFVDINPETYLADVSKLEDAITPRTRCIMPVHLFGQCVEMDRVADVAKRHDLRIVEDCAQSHGANHHGTRAGSMSDLSVFSFYPTKVLGGYGDAGMVLTDGEDLAERLKRLRFYGMESSYYSEEHGYNSRVDELQAEILLRKLKRLDGYIERRRHLASRYDRMLASTTIRLPVTAPGNEHVYYLYVCRHPDRDRIIEELAKREIFVNVSYPWPIHIMKGYADLGYREGDLPETEAAAREIFSLPIYPSFSEDAQEVVCRALGEILGEKVDSGPTGDP